MDPRSPGRVIGDPQDKRSEQEHMEDKMVMKTASVKSRRKKMVSSSRLPVRRERGRHEGIKTWGSPDMRRQLRWQVYRFELQNQAAVGLPVWVSKSGMRSVPSDGGVGGHVASSRSLR